MQMIWVRRLIAVVLGVALLASLVTAVVWRVASRVTDPRFIESELVKADVYNFVYDDVLDTTVGNAVEKQAARGFTALPDGIGELKLEDPEKTGQVVVDAIKTTFPQQYTRQQVEGALDEVVPYLKGQADTFEIKPHLDERVRAGATAVSAAIEELHLASQIVDNVVAPNLEIALSQLSVGGSSVNITPEQAREIAHRIAPEEWVNARINDAMGQVVGWLTGDQDSFAIHVLLADRVPAARDEIKAVLQEAGFSQLLFDSVLTSQLTAALGQSSSLSYGIDVTTDEVRTALRAAAPPEWVDQQVGSLIDATADYLAGVSGDIAVTVPLSDRRAATIDALTTLAESKLRQAVALLPACQTGNQSIQAGADVAGQLMPACLPPGMDAGTVVSSLAPVLRTDVDSLIGTSFPRSITLDRAELEGQLGLGAFASLDHARSLIGGGLTWTDQDLARSLAQSNSKINLEDMRKYFQPGFALTQADLHSALLKASDGTAGVSPVARFDRLRSIIHLAYSLGWLTIALPILVAGLIALLGGRRWPTRLAWGATALTITSLLLWVALSQAYARTQPRLHDALVTRVADSTLDTANRALALTAMSKVELFADDIAGTATGFARGWTIAGMVALAGSVVWLVYERSEGRGREGVARWLRRRNGSREPGAAASDVTGDGAGAHPVPARARAARDNPTDRPGGPPDTG